MGGCSAFNCSNSSSKGHQMFRFPTNPERRKKWAIHCRRDKWIPGKHALLCSEHFEVSQYEPHREGKKKLRQDAIPTKFNVPNPPQLLENKRVKGIGLPNSGTILDKPKHTKLIKMVKSCCAIGCTNRFAKGNGISFHRFPTDERKKSLWIHALKRKNWNPSPYTFICGIHFQTGKPSSDENHPDFLPNVFSYSKGKVRNAMLYEARQKHVNISTKANKELEKKQEMVVLLDPQECLLSDDVKDIDKVKTDSTNENSSFSEKHLIVENKKLKEENKKLKEEEKKLKEENEKMKAKIENLEKLMRDNATASAIEMHHLKEEINNLKEKLESTNFPTLLLNDEKRLIFFTGVPNRNAFDWILSITKSYINESFLMPLEHQLLIVLVKLKMSYRDEDIAIRFNTSRRTVCRIFKTWLPISAKVFPSFFPDIKEKITEMDEY